MVAVVFSSNDIKAVMLKLQPSNVPRWVEDLARPAAQRFSQPGDSQTASAEFHMNSVWHRDVANPSAMLAGTMQELSSWGTSTAASIACCWVACLCWTPTVVAHSLHTAIGTLSFLVALVVLPIVVTFAPARISTRCDMLLDQLNDISFMVGVMPRFPCCTQVAHVSDG